MKKFAAFAAMAIFAAFIAIAFTAPHAEAAKVIGEERAKAIAVKHAKVPQKEVRFTKVKFEKDHGRAEYEIEFVFKDTEYEYEIQAETGKILKFSQEKKHDGKGGAPKPHGGLISEDMAKEIALSRMPGARENDITKFEFDYEDGLEVFEGEIFHDTMEYEFKIDARNGEILEWEMER